MRAVALLLLAAVGCFNPAIGNGFACPNQGRCPDGFSCCSDDTCRKDCGGSESEAEAEAESESESEAEAEAEAESESECCGDGFCSPAVCQKDTHDLCPDDCWSESCGNEACEFQFDECIWCSDCDTFRDGPGFAIGDGQCEGPCEDCGISPDDCAPCDGDCDMDDCCEFPRENCANCAEDCKPCDDFCQGDKPECILTASCCGTCAGLDIGVRCGDSSCNGLENIESCPCDCLPPECM